MLPPHPHFLPRAGLSGSGKSTVACTLEHLLHERGHFTSLLDGDNIRHGLNKDLGFRCGGRSVGSRSVQPPWSDSSSRLSTTCPQNPVALCHAAAPMPLKQQSASSCNSTRTCCALLSCSSADRTENIRRIGEVALLFANAGKFGLLRLPRWH